MNFSGYMSPEYAIHGFFSIKSDVFSFGVLLLETLSSKRSTRFFNTNSLTLLGHVSKIKFSHFDFILFKLLFLTYYHKWNLVVIVSELNFNH